MNTEDETGPVLFSCDLTAGSAKLICTQKSIPISVLETETAKISDLLPLERHYLEPLHRLGPFGNVGRLHKLSPIKPR